MNAAIYVATLGTRSAFVCTEGTEFGRDEIWECDSPQAALRAALEWWIGSAGSRPGKLTVVWDRASAIPLACKILSRQVRAAVRFDYSPFDNQPALRRLQEDWKGAVATLAWCPGGLTWNLPALEPQAMENGQRLSLTSLGDIVRYANLEVARATVEDSVHTPDAEVDAAEQE